MNQCHLAFMRNEKQVSHKKEKIECNELNEEMQYLGKNHNALLVKNRKLMKAHEDVINETAND